MPIQMKNLLLAAIFLVFNVSVSHAVIRTVSNWSFSPGQFTSPAAALALSNPGDTIYIHGSSLNYGNFTVDRSGVVIIGAGHNPAKVVPLATSFAAITLSSASSCQFIGLSFNSIVVNSTCNFIVVKRCKIQVSGSTTGIIFSFGSMQNWLIEGNVFLGLFDSINYNFAPSHFNIIRNNVFNSAISNNGASTSPFTFQISNNIFLGNIPASFGNIQQALINNNIFYRSSPQGTSTGCTMNNNISFMCPNNNFSAGGLNNLVGVNPLFTNFPGGGANFDYAHDYHLAAGSPGLLTGDDGTDRGVYGGFGAKFNMTGEPAIAEITSVTITSPSIIAPGGSLTISVTSKRVN